MSLFDLVETGDVAGLRASIDAGADVSVLNVDGQTLLMRAIWRRSPAMACLLIEAGCPLRMWEPNFETTAMFWAVFYDQPDIVQLLLGAGVRMGDEPEIMASAMLRRGLIYGTDRMAKTILRSGEQVFERDVFRLEAHRCPHIWRWVLEVVLWRWDASVVELEQDSSQGRAEAVQMRRVRDLIRPLVDPRRRALRSRCYAKSPLLRLSWDLRVRVLSFVVVTPDRPGWSEDERRLELLQPMVDPSQKPLRGRLYRESPLRRLPWHLRVDVLRFASPSLWDDICGREHWGREEFEV